MNKYKKMKKQVSTDGGQTWQDVIPYQYQKGTLIESDSPDCNNITWELVDDEYICEQATEPMTEWRTVSGEYVCTGYDKYTKEAEYRSLDGGSTWTATGNERTGSMIERNSSDCNYPGDTDCYITEGGGMSVGYTSISEGQTIAYKYDFTNTGCFYRETQERYSSSDTGDINYPLQYNMFFPDCDNNVAFGMSVSYFADGEGSFPIDYKFIFADCEGIVQTIFQDANIGTSSCGDAALEKSNFAVTARTLWNCITKLETSGRYTFAGIIQKDEYSKALLRFDFDTVNKTVSNVSLTVSCIHKRYRRVPVADSYICEGTDKYQAVRVYESDDDGETWTDMGIQAGLLIEANSEDCGYTPPTPTAKAILTYQNGDTYVVPWNDSATLTQAEIRRGIDSSSDSHYYRNITDVTVYPVVTSISTETFSYCTSLETVTFNMCNALSGALAYYIFTNCNTIQEFYFNATDIQGDSSTQGTYNWYVGLTINHLIIGPCVDATHNIQYNRDFFRKTRPQKVTFMLTTVPNLYYESGRYDAYLQEVEFSDSTTAIADNAFRNCNVLSTIRFGNGVRTIGNYTFADCDDLVTVNIPDNVTAIGDYAFYGCNDLTTVTIGTGVTSIGDYAFASNSNLTSLTCLATTPPTLGSNLLTWSDNCQIFVPAASVSTYQSASGWSTYASRIQAIP